MHKKHTKIVATISDQRCSQDHIRELFEAGMNVVRLNTAHQDLEGSKKVVDSVRNVSEEIAILIDTKGPEIRTTVARDPIEVNAGETIPMDSKILWGEASVNESIVTGESVPVFRKMHDILLGGSTIENGTIKAYVTAVGDDTVLANILKMVKQTPLQLTTGLLIIARAMATRCCCPPDN